MSGKRWSNLSRVKKSKRFQQSMKDRFGTYKLTSSWFVKQLAFLKNKHEGKDLINNIRLSAFVMRNFSSVQSKVIDLLLGQYGFPRDLGTDEEIDLLPDPLTKFSRREPHG